MLEHLRAPLDLVRGSRGERAVGGTPPGLSHWPFADSAARRRGFDARRLLASARLASLGARPRADYSRVTSGEQAQRLLNQGRLVRVLLLPAALGGAEAEANQVYVPPEVISVQASLTDTLERYLREGRIDDLSIAPQFKGRSLVPSRIHVAATKSGRADAFTTVIGIW